MARILNPLFKEKEVVKSTVTRFNNIFQPIQATRRKSSDFLAYATTPFIDAFILEPAFAINVCIELVNAMASFIRALFFWVINQSRTDELLDQQTDNLMDESFYFLGNAMVSLAAQLLNTIFSTFSLFTRPVASLAYALFGDCCDEDPKQAYYQQQQEQDFRDSQLAHRYAAGKPRAYQDRAEEFQYSTSSHTPTYHH